MGAQLSVVPKDIDSNNQKAKRAVRLVAKYEHKNGRTVVPAQRRSGYDLVSRGKRGHIRTIEVKGTKKPTLAIPDLAETEFGRNKQLKATHLYVVSNIDRKPKLYIVSRSELAHAIIRAKGLKQLIRWRVPGSAQKLLRDSIQEESL